MDSENDQFPFVNGAYIRAGVGGSQLSDQSATRQLYNPNSPTVGTFLSSPASLSTMTDVVVYSDRSTAGDGTAYSSLDSAI